MCITILRGTLLRNAGKVPARKATMWTVITSQGQRVDGITHEHTALRTVHSMGMTTLIAPYRYLVVDNRGQQFHAEIHRYPVSSLRLRQTR